MIKINVYDKFNSMKTAVIFLTILLLINGASFYFDWYLQYFWFDMTLHFLGGFFIAMLMADYLKDNLAGSKLKNLIVIIGATIFIGVVWEFTEYLASQTLIEPIYNNFSIRAYFIGDLDDTINDLLMDILGAGAFSFALHFIRSRKAHQVQTNF